VYALLVFGATVRVHGAGLSCPDWPLCFGRILPQFDFGVFLEWGHRVLASVVSIGFLTLGAAVMVRPQLRAAAGSVVLAGLVVLAVQVVLGGLTVLHLLASWTVVAHLLTGNLFLLVMLLVAERLAPGPTVPVAPLARALLLALVVAVPLQMALGGLVSSTHAGAACTQWPMCSNNQWFPSWEGAVGLQIVHRLGAYAVGLLALALAVALRGGLGWMILAMVLAQIALGVLNAVMRMPVEIAVAHSALADALWATVVVASWRRRGQASTRFVPVPS
jgi:cytochrome c oxidase assembly protein subunit 15